MQCITCIVHLFAFGSFECCYIKCPLFKVVYATQHTLRHTNGCLGINKFVGAWFRILHFIFPILLYFEAF